MSFWGSALGTSEMDSTADLGTVYEYMYGRPLSITPNPYTYTY